MLILIVASGPDKGRLYELHDGKSVVLGREGDQVKLTDTKVSRQHAEILESESGGARTFRIQDRGSVNGTYVNKERIESKELVSGDEVQIGKFRFLYLDADK